MKRPMLPFLLAGLALVAAPAHAETTPEVIPDSVYYSKSKTHTRRLDWAELDGQRLAGTVRPAAKGLPGAVLHVVNKTGLPRTYVLGIFESPDLTSDHYVVSGRVRYDKVAKQGYFEMWSVFPDGKQYFTRTLETSGPMARLAGNSNWRDMALPFDATAANARPTRLIVQLVLAANGAVDIGPLELKEMQ